MRFRSILSEGWRNFCSGVSRGALFALALSCLAGALGFLEVSTVSDLLQRADAYRSSGASIMVNSAEGKIDPVECAKLAQLPGVRASGAIRKKDDLSIGVLPSSPVPVKQATYGFFDLLKISPGSQGLGVLVSKEFSDTFGVSGGESLETASKKLNISGVYEYPDDGRKSGLGYAILETVPPSGKFDECWMEAWPRSRTAEALLRTMSLKSGASLDGAQPQSYQLNSKFGQEFYGSELFEVRVSQYAVYLALAVGFLLGFISVRMRRLELSSARHSAVSLSAQMVQVIFETVLWVLSSLILSLAALMLFARLFAHESSWYALLLLGLRIMVPGFCAVFAGVFLGVLMTREKHLFKYFKDR